MITISKTMAEKDADDEFFNENVEGTSQMSKEEMALDGVVLLISKTIFNFFKEESGNTEDSYDDIITHLDNFMISSDNRTVTPSLECYEKLSKERPQHDITIFNEHYPRNSISDQFTGPNLSAQNGSKISFHHKKTSLH